MDQDQFKKPRSKGAGATKETGRDMENLTFRRNGDDQNKNAVIIRPCFVKVEKTKLSKEKVAELKKSKNNQRRKNVPVKTKGDCQRAGKNHGVRRNKNQFISFKRSQGKVDLEIKLSWTALLCLVSFGVVGYLTWLAAM